MTTAALHAFRPIAECPSCRDWDAPIPTPGERCTGVLGVRCRACRCTCGALCRGFLVGCPHCEALVPVHVDRTTAELEADSGQRGAPRPACTVGVFVDLNGSGAVWVDAAAWPRMDRRPSNIQAVLEAARRLELCELRLVGKAQRVREGTSLTVPGHAVVLGNHGTHGGVKRYHLTYDARHHERLPAAKPRVELDLGELLKMVRLYEHAAKGERGSRDDEPPITSAQNKMRKLLYEALTQRNRLRLDVDDLEAPAVARLLDTEHLIEWRQASWSPAFMEGRHFCAGKACPGLALSASREHPHPPSCCGPDQVHPQGACLDKQDRSPADQIRDEARAAAFAPRTKGWSSHG